MQSFRIALFAVCLLPLSARADIPIDDVPHDDPAQHDPDASLTDFERGERIGNVIGACVCPACCGLGVLGGAIGAAVYFSRKKASP